MTSNNKNNYSEMFWSQTFASNIKGHQVGDFFWYHRLLNAQNVNSSKADDKLQK